MKRFTFFLFSICCLFNSYCTIKSDSLITYSIIPHYSFSTANNEETNNWDSYKYIGLSMNYYHVGLTPISVYISDFNRLNKTDNQHQYLTYAPGITLGIRGNSGMGLEFSRNAARSTAEFKQYAVDSSIVDIKERIRLVNSQLKLVFSTQIPRLKGLTVGASIDFSLIRNNLKRNGGDYTGKWSAFYTHNGLTKEFKTSELIAGLGIRAGYQMNHFLIIASTQFLFIKNEVSGYAGTDLLMNTQHYQISISYAFE